MAIVTTEIPEVQAIMETQAERDLYIIAREMERPPYWHAEEGMNARLGKALRIVLEGRLTPGSDGAFAITGSTGKSYRVTETCSCPQGQSRRTKYCLHYIATVLYTEWCRRQGHTPQGLPRPTDDRPMVVLPAEPGERSARVPFDSTGDGASPVDDRTLPLALPPVTVDERLAQMPAPPPQDGPGKEIAPMADDTYIPEPEMDDAPVAVLERPTKAVTPRVETTDLEMALTTWTAERRVVQRFLKQELKPNIDYYTLKIGGRDSKPSLSKAGAEKVMGWLKLQAAFTPDTGTWEMLGRPADQVFYVCTLRTRSGEIVGEGRGARSLKKDGGDVNKSIKMAEKSACVAAVLRTGALSDVFTQDLEPDEREEPAPAPGKTPTSADLRQQIWTHIKQQAPDITGREEAGRWVKERTGYALVESNFANILHALAVG